MFSLVVSLILGFAGDAQPLKCDHYSADLIATVASVYQDNGYCYTFLQAEKIEFFKPDPLCPLSFVKAQGYPIQLKNSPTGDCRFFTGDLLSGVLTDDGREYLKLY